ncbi:MAG: hypothetical protein JJT96_01170 [Opitutales bacterium]|nr:hypothetical protein [Opitutales bacterium]
MAVTPSIISSFHQQAIRFLAAGLVLAILHLIGGCGKQATEPDLPEAAQTLVNPPPEIAAEVLPHTVDSATEFEAALETVAEDAKKPTFRETELRSVAVVTAERRATGLTPTPKNTEVEGARPQTVVLVPPASNEVRSWGSIILVPDVNKMSRAFTSDVRLERIEAHPLSDNRLRVWVRVRNLSNSPREIGVALDFRTRDRSSDPTDFVNIRLDGGDVVDAHFLSPEPGVLAYTILAK